MTNDLLHRVVNGHERLQPLPMQEVGELHVNGSHWTGVLHDPVFVHIWGVVVAWSAAEIKKDNARRLFLYAHVLKLEARKNKHLSATSHQAATE